MTETPDIVIAGHLVIYRGNVVVFHADGCDHQLADDGLCEHIVKLPVSPPMMMAMPLLIKLLSGKQLDASDVPAGAGMLTRKMTRAGRNGG